MCEKINSYASKIPDFVHKNTLQIWKMRDIQVASDLFSVF
jgi:hypothetical protein